MECSRVAGGTTSVDSVEKLGFRSLALAASRRKPAEYGLSGGELRNNPAGGRPMLPLECKPGCG